jgi:hypothetical protein
VRVEHLGLAHLNDSSLTLPPLFNTTLDFLFKAYLKDSVPDLVIFGPPFIHEHGLSLSRTKQLFIQLHFKLRQVLSLSTDVIWMPSACTWMSKKINDRLVALNHFVFQSLKSRFMNEKDNWFAFYDENSLACAIPGLKADGVHMQHEYYNVIMEHLLNMFCTT